jgi:hypothetical protein
VEWLELVELLPGAREQDRLPDHLFHRQRGAAAGIAVDLGEDHPGEADGGVELGGDVDGLLAGHGIDDEQRVVGLDDVAHLPQLVHQLGVDLQAAGGVDDHDVATEARRLLERAPRHRDRIGRLGVHGHADTLAEHPELLDRGRTLEVGADQQRPAVLALQQAGELGRAVMLRALGTRHHHAGRLRRRRELAGGAAEGLDELLVDDLDDLLRGAEALRDLRTLGALLDPADEVAGDEDVDVGLEQRDAQLATDLVDLLVGELPAAPELVEDSVEAVSCVSDSGVGVASSRAATTPRVRGDEVAATRRPDELHRDPQLGLDGRHDPPLAVPSSGDDTGHRRPRDCGPA